MDNNLDAIFHYASSSTSPAVSSHLSLNMANHRYSHEDHMSTYNKNHYEQSGYDREHHLVGENQISSSENLAMIDRVSPSTDSFGTCDGNELNTSMKSPTKVNDKKGAKKIKKPKYAFQTRSRVDILDDGYRWRKYGQKAVKNNKFPRSYYRCTQQGCNVKKQVQRLSKDEGVVVTTYEGIHTHPIDKSTDNFEHILAQMQIYSS
ncbi:probable WRKY transcription factor 56 [Rutidosis leptorrhynchoides]|uniref:probable WRKY transcription factor 56 n=1 Tax=Rutidosis leptorrhynchoides TaxID=125765 RepID=UPI003A99416F